MNNNKNDEAALLAGGKGVFSKTSYITFGTTDKPEEYIKKNQERAAFKGKQFGYAPPKEGVAGAATNDVYLEKKHNWISDGDKYVDKIRYSDSKNTSVKSKGFLTSDFSKRDEFSNVIRTEQYREQLKQEDKFAKKGLAQLTGGMETMTVAETTASPREDGPLLYDLVFEKEDPTFKGSSRTHRDTKNPTQLSHERKLGSTVTSQTVSFQAPTEFHKAEYARRPIVKDTFYRETNVLFPKGCSANPAI